MNGSVPCVPFPETVQLNTLALVIHACLMYAAVCEEVCGKPNLFDDQLRIMETVRCMDDVRELIKQQDQVTQLEDRVKAWMKKVQEVYYFIFRHCTGLHSFFFILPLSCHNPFHAVYILLRHAFLSGLELFLV